MWARWQRFGTKCTRSQPPRWEINESQSKSIKIHEKLCVSQTAAIRHQMFQIATAALRNQWKPIKINKNQWKVVWARWQQFDTECTRSQSLRWEINKRQSKSIKINEKLCEPSGSDSALNVPNRSSCVEQSMKTNQNQYKIKWKPIKINKNV